MDPNIELLAPAGSFEALTAAIQAGANAVYFGVEQLNMRARATMNFLVDDMPEISKRCREKGVRTYLTLNTVIFDHDISLLQQIVTKAKQANISAVIASDMAVIMHCTKAGIPVHISTQLNITNIEAVKFYAQFADVMVLARELSLRQMKAICSAIEKQQVTGPSGKIVQIEVFAHGALCMAVSGKCYLSLHTKNASANRGACVQNCRRKYKVVDIEDGHELEIDNEYIMSPKDLCTIEFLDHLLATGVSVLKIEGRGKSADYVYTTTACYREAIEAVKDGSYSAAKVQGWMNRLEQVYNRGFWGGYYLGKQLGEWTHASGSIATQKKIYIGKGNHYYPKRGIAEFKIESYDLRKGDKVLIIGPTTGVLETTIETLHVNDDGAKDVAVKGDLCAFAVTQAVRTTDKLYKLVVAGAE